MATQPAPALPIFYKALIPLSGTAHTKFQTKGTEAGPYFVNQHAVPLTIDEFILAQRHYPIVFTMADEPVPLALMGLNEGVNVFVDDKGNPHTPFYVPAYVRRYPFMLARMTNDTQELSLCFDPESDLVGPFKDGNPLFEDGKPTENLNNIVKFCEDFEVAARRTNDFMIELKKYDLLMDGEVSIQTGESEVPYVYRGFKMVDEEKLRNLGGEQLSEIAKNGVLSLIMAHLFSMNLMREIFAAQMVQGKVPPQTPVEDAPLTVN